MLAGHIVLLAWRWNDSFLRNFYFFLCDKLGFVTSFIDFSDEFLGFLC